MFVCVSSFFLSFLFSTVVFLAFLFFHLPSMQLYWINIFFRFSCNYKSLIEFSRLVVFFFAAPATATAAAAAAAVVVGGV